MEALSKKLAPRVKIPSPRGNPLSGQTIAYDYVGGVIVVVTKADPVKSEWDQYCAFCSHHGPTLRGIAVYDRGGGPNPAQRKQVQQSLSEPPKIAIFTTSDAMRHIAAAFSLFDPKRRIRWFPPVEEAQALAEHLALSDPNDRMAVNTTRRRLEKTLGVAA